MVKTKILTNSPSSTHRLEKVRIKLGIASLLVGIWDLVVLSKAQLEPLGFCRAPARILNDNPFRKQL